MERAASSRRFTSAVAENDAVGFLGVISQVLICVDGVR